MLQKKSIDLSSELSNDSSDEQLLDSTYKTLLETSDVYANRGYSKRFIEVVMNSTPDRRLHHYQQIVYLAGIVALRAKALKASRTDSERKPERLIQQAERAQLLADSFAIIVARLTLIEKDITGTAS